MSGGAHGFNKQEFRQRMQGFITKEANLTEEEAKAFFPIYNEYKDKQRTDKITGYRYVVCLVEHHLEKLSVRIDGEQRMEQPDGFVEVDFDGLEVSAYESQGKVQFTAKAADIFDV